MENLAGHGLLQPQVHDGEAGETTKSITEWCLAEPSDLVEPAGRHPVQVQRLRHAADRGGPAVGGALDGEVSPVAPVRVGVEHAGKHVEPAGVDDDPRLPGAAAALSSDAPTRVKQSRPPAAGHAKE